MLLLLVGIMCLALAGWSLIRGEFGDALQGLAFGVMLLLYWRWAWDGRGQQARGPTSSETRSLVVADYALARGEWWLSDWVYASYLRYRQSCQLLE